MPNLSRLHTFTQSVTRCLTKTGRNKMAASLASTVKQFRQRSAELRPMREAPKLQQAPGAESEIPAGIDPNVVQMAKDLHTRYEVEMQEYEKDLASFGAAEDRRAAERQKMGAPKDMGAMVEQWERGRVAR